MLLVQALAEAPEEAKITLFGKNLQTGDMKSIGVVRYKPDIQKGMYEPTDEVLDNSSKYCIGTNDLSNHECFAQVEDLSSKQFVVQLNQEGGIEYITTHTIDVASKKKGKKKDVEMMINGLRQRVMVKPGVLAPEPNLNPSNVAKKHQQQQQQQLATKGEGKDEEEKSWVQKNWMYIVPPLLILFVLLGDEEKK